MKKNKVYSPAWEKTGAIFFRSALKSIGPQKKYIGRFRW